MDRATFAFCVWWRNRPTSSLLDTKLKTIADCRRVRSHRLRDETRRFCCVGVRAVWTVLPRSNKTLENSLQVGCALTLEGRSFCRQCREQHANVYSAQESCFHSTQLARRKTAFIVRNKTEKKLKENHRSTAYFVSVLLAARRHANAVGILYSSRPVFVSVSVANVVGYWCTKNVRIVDVRPMELFTNRIGCNKLQRLYF